MLAPTSSSPPNGITLKTFLDKVALELPVGEVILRGVAAVAREARLAAPELGRMGRELRDPTGDTRRGEGFAIIDCFQVFVSKSFVANINFADRSGNRRAEKLLLLKFAQTLKTFLFSY